MIYTKLYTKLQQMQLFSLGCHIHISTYVTLTLTLTITLTLLTLPTLLLGTLANMTP